MVTRNARPMRFHWSLSAVGDPARRSQAMATMSGAPDFDAHVDFCHRAEEAGIESLLMAFGFTRPDPVVWSAALGRRTSRIKFLVAVRSGVSSPTYFVQQVNTLSGIVDGRVCINIVAGRAPDEQRFYGDFLSHDERYERTDEFWTIAHALWRRDGPVDFAGKHYRIEGGRLNSSFISEERTRPEIYIGGNSEQATALAIRHADCLLTLPDAPRRMAERIRPVVEAGTEVGLLVSLLAQPTRDEAVRAAGSLVEAVGEPARAVHAEVRRRSDSVGFTTVSDRARHGSSWLTPSLWTGAVPYFGAPSIALVGSADDVAEAIFEYRRIGVTQFLFMGLPDDLEQVAFFGSEILPRIRDRERGRQPQTTIRSNGH
jgi:alkanesulfonate monooxygenase